MRSAYPACQRALTPGVAATSSAMRIEVRRLSSALRKDADSVTCCPGPRSQVVCPVGSARSVMVLENARRISEMRSLTAAMVRKSASLGGGPEIEARRHVLDECGVAHVTPLTPVAASDARL